jgi:imidazolonepropionase-like amidohydrolase
MIQKRRVITKQILQLGLCLLASISITVNAKTLIVDSVTLIDGTGAAPLPEMTVVIEDGEFSQILPSVLAKDISGDRIDGKGKFLIPGLMDMHMHLKGGYSVSAEGIAETSSNRKLGLEALHSYLYSGVTSIYDAGNNPDYIYDLRSDERNQKIISPRIFAAGGVVTQRGSHDSGAGATTVESWPEAREKLDKHIALHPDILKLTFDERGWGARPMITKFDPELMQTIIEYYNDHGIRTTVHSSSELRARQAIFAGIDTLAHPVIQGPISDSFASLMAAKKTPMTTTLTIGEGYSRLVEHPEFLDQPLYQQALSKDEISQLKGVTRDEWQKNLWTKWMKLMTPIAQENLRKIHEAGGTLVLGTDQSIGPAVHREMELLQASGIKPLDIIRIATSNGAVFLGKQETLGSIEVGKIADAVLLDADPSKDINNIKRIVLVIKNGDRIDRSKL